MLTADTGYFSIDNGKMINHEIYTTYFDAITEGNIYLTVDNETIEYCNNNEMAMVMTHVRHFKH